MKPLVVSLVLALHFSAAAAEPAKPEKRAEPVAANWQKELKLPAGYDATLFAAPPLVNYPVFVAAAPDGTLFVSSDKNGSLGRDPHRGSVIRLRDTDGDGPADESKKFVPDVDSPRGLVWDHDRLYLMHPPHLSAFIDKDGDGVADEQKVLVKNLAFTFKDRPADHTTNGVTLGIDGWLYIAVGDFGFLEAEGTDGRKLSFRYGGVVRVRPDGTGLEVYSRGTRNILEVALDPLLNGFIRDNTNDGGGWDIRLHHFSGMEDHGYPRLFKNFPDEIVQPLADYGGGSGCGALYLSEPGFPDGDGDAILTADWGRNWIYRHKTTPKGATFTVDQKEFIGLPRVTDLDVDASSRLYAASWKGATFNYAGEEVGYIVRVAPNGYVPEPLPDFEKAGDTDLVKLLESPSHRRGLEAQRALLRRGEKPEVVNQLAALAKDRTKPLAARVAAVFTIKQSSGTKAADVLTSLAEDETVREFALRALTDRLEENAAVPAAPIAAAIKDADPRIRNVAAISAARLGRIELASGVAELLGDADPIVAHTAVQSLVELRGAEAAFAVLDNADAPGPQRAGALRVLQSLHEPAVVEGLIARLNKANSQVAATPPTSQIGSLRHSLLIALSRLYHTEAKWKGDSWGTRPDTRGPYYQPEGWAGTEEIDAVLKAELEKAESDEAAFLVSTFTRHRISPGDTTGKLIELAGKDPSLIPAATAQLATSDSVPASAVPLLVSTATAETGASVVRSQSIIALAKTDSRDGVKASLAALAQLEKAKDRQHYEKARDAFLNSPRLENHHHLLEELAATLSGGVSVWADAALVKLSTRKSGSPESREMSAKALDAGWANAKRRAQIITAAGLANTHFRIAQLVAALDDPDHGVAAAAAIAIRALKIDPEKFKAGAKPGGPTIATMKADDVIAAVLTMKGDTAKGEQLFAQQACNACHTVKQSDPPKGPFLGNIATIYKRKELAEAILIPSKTLAQGFVTNAFELKNGTQVEGFVTQEAADVVTVRDVAGQELRIVLADVAKRTKLDRSMMPEGLASGLTVQEFASLLDYLEAVAKK